MIVTRGRAWRDALHRDLAQLGLEWPDADSLMEDCSVGGMDLDLYWRAQRVIREHRDMQETLFHADRIADGTSRRTLTEAAAERTAAGPGRVDADPCTDGGRGDHPALGPVRYAPGRRDVHFALESAAVVSGGGCTVDDGVQYLGGGLSVQDFSWAAVEPAPGGPGPGVGGCC